MSPQNSGRTSVPLEGGMKQVTPEISPGQVDEAAIKILAGIQKKYN